MRYLLLIGLLVLSCAGYTQSLSKDYTFSNVGMTFLSVSADARSAALGDMGVATLPDASSHQQNAAKYLFLDSRYKGGIHLFYIPWLRQLIDDMSISGVSAHYKIGQLQSVSASFRYFSLGALQKTDEHMQSLGEDVPHELAFDVAYARRLGSHFSMSVAFRLAVSAIVPNYRKARAVSCDLCGYYERPIHAAKRSYTLGIGFALNNVGNKIAYTPDDRLFLPSELKVGVNCSGSLVQGHGLSVGVEGGKYLVASGENDLNSSVIGCMGRAFAPGEIHRIHWKTGFEYNFHDLLFGRIGYCHEGKSGLQRRYMTFGAGIRFMRIHFDAAYLVSRSHHNHPMDNSFRLSAGVSFDPKCTFTHMTSILFLLNFAVKERLIIGL